MQMVNVLLFDGFETLDAFGPVELLGRLSSHYSMVFYSLDGGAVESAHKVEVNTRPLSEMAPGGVLLIPGGMGTRKLALNEVFLAELKRAAEQSAYILCVCTGSALLAASGLLDGRAATSNKRAFEWASSFGRGVKWQKSARWVVDGNIYTSSGVSAGMDMALGFVAAVNGLAVAEESARGAEYIWNSDKDNDPFALL